MSVAIMDDEAVKTEAAAGGGANEELKILELGAIAPSRLNHRKTFKAMEELANSIRTQGVLQPIVVRPMPRNGAGIPIPTQGKPVICYELVVGERRWRASQMVGAATIPAIVRDYSDTQVLEIQVVENNQREDPDPLEQAEGYRRMIDEAGYTVATLAQKIGRSDSYVYARLQLTRLTKKWQEMLSAGDISLGHAELVARLNEKDQDELHQGLFRFNSDRLISIAELRRTIKDDFVRDVKNAPWLTVENQAYKAGLDGPVGAFCCVCQKRSGFQPDLFPDIGKKKDLCMDRGCFDRKRSAFVQLQVKKLSDEGQQPVRISSSWSPAGKGVLRVADYQIVEKKDLKKTKDAVPAVMNDGPDAGTIVHVKVTKRETPSSGGGYAGTYWEEENRKRRKKEELSREIGKAAVLQALEKIEGETPKDLFVRFMANYAEMSTGGHSRFFVEKLGHKWKDSRIGQVQIFQTIFRSITPEQLHQFYLISEAESAFSEYSCVDMKDLTQLLKPYGVDVAKVAEMVKAQRALKQEEKKPGKKKSKGK